MRIRNFLVALVACSVFISAGQVFGQTGNASLGGIVADATKALIPGVTITATNTATGVTTTQLTNDSGAYSFPVLQPGTYKVSAELQGFKKTVHDNIQLGYATQIRDDFRLEIGAANQVVEVAASAEAALKESSASIGQVLTESRVMNLPLVGNNVLSLLTTLPGVNLGANFDPGSNTTGGEGGNTIAGLSMDSVNVTRDGLSTNDTRFSATVYGSLAFSSTQLNPDLIGEIRLIVSPVDAELGRGNGQIQIRTRSGTNKFTGSATWNVRNSALDANTWTNNHTPFTDPNTNVVTNKTLPAWNNDHQYSVAYGGPVVIPHVYNGRNKTFFYGLYEQNIRNTRETTNVNVITDTARMGIFRYYTGYNPAGWNPNSGILNPQFPLTATSATAVAVDFAGNPVAPLFNPDGSQPYTGKLICLSVFGNRRLDTDFNLVPFTPADCPGGSISLPPAANNGLWDVNRPTQDTTGYIKKILSLTPHPNYYGAGDGLNVAQYRYQRRRGGNNSNNAQVGGDLYANNKQYNIKIDHNFTNNHKAAFNYTYQINDSADNVAQYPDGISGAITRRPMVFTLNVTSTLSSRMINEARFGVNRNNEYDVPAWFSNDPETRRKAEDLLLRGSPSTLNPSYTYLTVINNGVGIVNNSSGYMDTTVNNFIAENPLWNYADTLSWSTGKHAFKFGAEVRLPRTGGTGELQPYPSIALGNNTNANTTVSPFSTVTNFATELPGLLNATVTGGNTARSDVRDLSYYLTGSVNNATQPYWVNSFTNVDKGLWSDYSTSGNRLRKQVWQEWDAFVKDDYKITRRLTLNLGVRWEFASAPFIDGGFTAAVKDYGYGAFGATRVAQTTIDKFNNDPFSIFIHPGNLFLTGYGTTPTGTPLSCQTGVQQNALLPVSTCDPNYVAAIRFVGPGSPNPSLKSEPVSYYNIGPAVGFAYQLPWFGEGKTSIRGGYQQTFGGAQAVRNNVPGGTEAEIANAPGAFISQTTTIGDPTFASILNTRAITLADVTALVPVRPNSLPGGAVPIYGRFAGGAGGVNVYDPNYKTPYTQNLNFSITRQVTRTTSLNIQYIGTFARRQKGSINMNTPNVYNNPELFQALTDARAGTCTANATGYAANYTSKGINPCDANGDPVLFDQLLAGLNLNVGVSGATGTGSFGFVGTNNTASIYQTGAEQLRRSGTFQANLANGDFLAVTNSLLGLTPTAAQGRQTAPIDPATGGTIGGVALVGLRNGCDRIANGASFVQQTITLNSSGIPTGVAFNSGFNASNATPLRCFSEDWLISNPQFGTTNYIANLGHNNYHSLQVGVSTRPINGITMDATWVWAKAMNQPTTNYFDPSRQSLNFGAQANNLHSLRTNGTIELPIGPNKLLFGNTSGIVARLLERWQTSFIANFATGTPASISPGTSHCYRATPSSCRYNVTADWVQPTGQVEWNTVNANTGAITGSFYGNPAPFTGVTDPQCLDPKITTPGDKMGTSLVTSSTGTAVCNITALAQRNPDGSTGKLLLVYSQPGQIGNSGNNNVVLFGRWSLDMNLSKSFRVSESKSVQLRFDATDVLNHPNLNNPTLSAGGGLGSITGKGTQTRKLQGTLRLQF